GWYRWQTVPANSNPDQQESQSPVFVHNGITTLSGHTRFTDKVSAFTKPVGEQNSVVEFGGYHGMGEISRNGRMTYVGDVDTFSFTEGEESINLQSLNLTMDSDLSRMDWELFVYPGSFDLSLAEINASVDNGMGTQEIKLHDLSMTSSVKLPADANWMSMDIKTAI